MKMFDMKIERQLDMKDRTLLLGVPRYDSIPEIVEIEGKRHKVIGVSHGVKPPFVSLEIERITKPVIGYRVTA